ncbi:MAG: hypothetical protein R2881_05010 [Eubacteriales bacterium]
MLGIIIGVMSVIVSFIAQSTTSSISSAIASMGSDLLTVTITDEDVTLDTDDYFLRLKPTTHRGRRAVSHRGQYRPERVDHTTVSPSA